MQIKTHLLPKSPFHGLFREMLKSWPNGRNLTHFMPRLRGNLKSKILLVAPPCSDMEYQCKTPFCDVAAQRFHQVLVDRTGEDTEKDFLVISCSLFGPKPCAASTQPVAALVSQAGLRSLMKCFICVGAEAFKHIFGDGRNPATETLFGSQMYIPRFGRVPVYTMPDVYPLNPKFVKEVTDADKKINWRLRMQMAEFNVKLEQHCDRLSAFLGSLDEKR